MFALSANAADGTVGTVSVQKGNNVSVNGEAPLSLTLDGKDHQSCQFLSKRAPDESHDFTWKEVTTTRGGELAEILGDQRKRVRDASIYASKKIAEVSILQRYFFVSTYQAAGPDTCLAVFVVASLPPCL